MKKRPIGFVATCRCGVVVGAVDFTRTHKTDAGKILGGWLYDGCSIEPRFEMPWKEKISPCACKTDNQLNHADHKKRGWFCGDCGGYVEGDIHFCP